MKLVNGRYSIDFEDFERRISHDTNTFILCNPQNPTGNCWSPEDLTRLGEICLQAPRHRPRRRDPLRLRHQGPEVHAVREPPEQGHRQQQPHVQGREQVVRPGGDEVRLVLLGQRRLMARVKANNRADLNTLGIVANQAAYARGRRLAESARRRTSTATTTSSSRSSRRRSR